MDEVNPAILKREDFHILFSFFNEWHDFLKKEEEHRTLYLKLSKIINKLRSAVDFTPDQQADFSTNAKENVLNQAELDDVIQAVDIWYERLRDHYSTNSMYKYRLKELEENYVHMLPILERLKLSEAMSNS